MTTDEDLEGRIARLRGLLGAVETRDGNEDPWSDDRLSGEVDRDAGSPRDDPDEPPSPVDADEPSDEATTTSPVVEVAREGTTQLDGEARAVAETVLQGFFASLASAADEPDDRPDDDATSG